MTLTETVFWGKIVGKFAIVFVILLVGGYYGFLYIRSITHPLSQIFKPDYACGLLPELTIDAQDGVSVDASKIKVESVKSSLPDEPYVTYVYKMDVKGETFETRDTAFHFADELGFDQNAYTKIPGSTTYSWRNRTKKTTLTFDTSTMNITYGYDESTLPKVPNLQLPPTVVRAPDIAQNMLSSLGLYTSDFANGQSFAVPVVYKDGLPYKADSLDSAQLIRVDFQKVNSLLVYDRSITSPTYAGPININFEGFLATAPDGTQSDSSYVRYTGRRVGKTPDTANVQVYLKAQNGLPQDVIHNLIFDNWHVSDSPCGTYPILRPADAVTAISSGKGKVVELVEKGGDTLQPHPVPAVSDISLYQLELAYYETMNTQQFLQPIYIATGEATFVDGQKGDIAIYIPAIDYEAQKKVPGLQ